MLSRRSLVVLGLIAAAVIALLAIRSRRGASQPAAGKAAATDAAAAERLARVERVVAERNKHNGEEERRFEQAGWKMVSAPPPDERVTSLDPSLIAEGREDELRVQAASTTPSDSAAHHLAQIVLMAQQPATREHAALALGRIHSAEAQEEIMNLLTGGKLAVDDIGRSQLAALLRPTDLDDEVAAKMADLLDHKALTPVEKDQVAFTLALVGLRDGMALPASVLATMSPEARARVAHMTEVGSRSFLARGHEHGHGIEKD